MAQQTEGPSRGIAYWQVFTSSEMFTPENKQYDGREIGEIAATEGKEPWDVVCRHRRRRRPQHDLHAARSAARTTRPGSVASRCGATSARSSARPTPARTSTSSPRSTTRRRCSAKRCASAGCSRSRRRSPAHRRAGPAVRADGTGPPGRGLARRHRRDRRVVVSGRRRSSPATTSRVARCASTARPTASTTCS